MSLSPFRACFALLLLAAALSSAPFGSLEQPPVASGDVALAAGIDGAGLAPSPRSADVPPHGLGPADPGAHAAALTAEPAPLLRAPNGPPAAAPPRRGYDAQAPPHA